MDFWIYVGRGHGISPSLTCSLGAICTHMHPTHYANINTMTHRDNTANSARDPGMLKAVDGSFEAPTAEVVTLCLLLSIGGSPP